MIDNLQIMKLQLIPDDDSSSKYGAGVSTSNSMPVKATTLKSSMSRLAK